MIFSVSDVVPNHRSTAAWAASLLQALARDEAAGRRPPRLTEPQLATWNRFRGRLSATDLLALLFEDAAVLHAVPFDATTIGAPVALAQLPESLAEDWLQALSSPLPSPLPSIDDLEPPSAQYIATQAGLLDLPTRMARSDLHVVKPHQRVLELPGTGGQLAHHIASSQSDLAVHDNFTIACGSWQELTLAGIVALDLAAPHTHFVMNVRSDDFRDAGHPIRQRTFDFVVGLHPDKGGPFHVDDQLAIWFSSATIVLV